MNEKEILQKIKLKVFDLLKNESTGHDYFHIERVVRNSIAIGLKEKCNLHYTLQLAYLHDVGDYKLYDGEDKTEEKVMEIIEEFDYSQAYCSELIKDIHAIGFKGGFNEKSTKIEVLIVQDADRLDAMGAIGIARAFAYGGKKGRLLYDPNLSSEIIGNQLDYQNSQAHTIQHFYDKLLKLKDLMNTETAKILADRRHNYMEAFLTEFYREWNESDLT
ncbi:MAG: HD domain-containing protein [Flavobacteriaceae bacterium]|nr:HD domain-containing protein [Flavobacteriaceae bacterium]